MARPANDSVLPFPPYGSFTSFLNDLNTMEVLPNRLNLQVFSGSYSGSAKQQILRALRFFDLMDEAGVPNELALRPLLNPETREAPLSALVRQHYKALIDLPLETAGPAEVNEWFNAIGMDAATTRKAKSFFLTAAKSNGIKMHSLVMERTRKGGGGVRRKRTKGSKITPQNGTTAGAHTGPSTPQGVVAATWPLSNGGTATLYVTGDPFSLPKEERDDLFSLADKMKSSKSDGAATKTQSGDATAER